MTKVLGHKLSSFANPFDTLKGIHLSHSFLLKKICKMKRMFVLASTLLFLLNSCTKQFSDEEGGCPLTMASIAGNYKVNSMLYKDQSGSSEIDFFQQLLPCEQDDVIALHADGKADYRDINLQCSPSQSYTAQWSLKENKIVMNGDEGEIIRFNCKELVVKSTGIYLPGDQLVTIYSKL
jgi:hypothetical protein